MKTHRELIFPYEVELAWLILKHFGTMTHVCWDFARKMIKNHVWVGQTILAPTTLIQSSKIDISIDVLVSRYLARSSKS